MQSMILYIIFLKTTNSNYNFVYNNKSLSYNNIYSSVRKILLVRLASTGSLIAIGNNASLAAFAECPDRTLCIVDMMPRIRDLQ